jgi:O-antigen ligase
VYKKVTITNLVFILYSVLIFSIIFTLRAITSISIGLLLMTAFLPGKKSTVNYHLLALSCLYFAWQLLGMLYTENLHEGYRLLGMHSGVFMIPAALMVSRVYIVPQTTRLLKLFIGFLLLALIICLCVSSYCFYFRKASSDTFFYHNLARPIGQHAVQLSILCYVAFVYALTLKRETTATWQSLFLNFSIPLLALFIFLLSSRLVLVITLVSLLYFLTKNIRTTKKWRWAIPMILIAVAGFFITPVAARFKEITRESANIRHREIFDANVYFNGVEFRLLQFKIVPSILSSQHCWIIGTGAGDAQEALNKKYRELNMYQGSGSFEKGYIGYNTHNQFLETLLQSGIIGILIFAAIFGYYLRLILVSDNKAYQLSLIIICAYCLNESVFETQYGIILFCLLPFLFTGTAVSFDKKKQLRTNPSANTLVYS